jgi:hypothetical protein
MTVDSAEHRPNCNHSAALHRQRGCPYDGCKCKETLESIHDVKRRAAIERAKG